MTFDEIKQRYIEGAPLDETLERLAEIGENPLLYEDTGSWSLCLKRFDGYGAFRESVREAMMAAFDAE